MKQRQDLERRLSALEKRLTQAIGQGPILIMRMDGDPRNPRSIQVYAGLSFKNGGPGASPEDPPEKNWSVHREDGETDQAFLNRAITAGIASKGRNLAIIMGASEALPGEPIAPTGVHVGLPDGGYFIE